MPKTIRSEGHIALIAALISARTAAGLTQAELAARLQAHQSLVARIETGQRRIDVPELVILCRAIGADAGAILLKVDEAVLPEARI